LHFFFETQAVMDASNRRCSISARIVFLQIEPISCKLFRMTQPTKQLTRFFVAALVALMAACAWIPSFDTKANEQVDAGLKRAAASYATARLLNGILSVVQETEIAAAPAGIGMTFSPGRILHLVEQFSQVMLVAMVAFGIEKVPLTVGASWLRGDYLGSPRQPQW
jgi:hypothetical protein